MALRLLKNGSEIPPSTPLEEEVARFCQDQDITLEWLDGQWWLHSDQPKERPIGIEFDRELERHLTYFKKSSIHKELLARAIGVKGSFRPRVVDLSAGLLGDSLLFLAMGCEVQACERHPVVALLISSALARARHPLGQKIIFIHQDAAEFLKQEVAADVIFFDPMFEDSNDKALPRKEMRIFRTVVKEDQDAAQVLTQALSQPIKRVVVKRPRYSQTLIPGEPLQYLGKATRYDVYFGQKHGPNVSNLLE